MAIVETYSRRQKRIKGEAMDVFTYDPIPPELRVQICHIWDDCLGRGKVDYVGENPAFAYLHKRMADEVGVFQFPYVQRGGDKTAVVNFFVHHANTEQELDLVDLSFRCAIGKEGDREWKSSFHVAITSKEAISDLNTRFLEHGIGYAFVEGSSPQLIRKDNGNNYAD